MTDIQQRIARLGIAVPPNPYHQAEQELAKAHALLDEFDAKMADFNRHMETMRRLAP